MRNMVPSVDLFAQKIYWSNKLAGDLPETNLTTYCLRPVGDNTPNNYIAFDIPQDHSDKVLKVTRRSAPAVYTFLLSVFKIMLYKYTGSNDIIVGSPAYNHTAEPHSASNVVPLRSSVKGALTFNELLLHVKEALVGAYSNQGYLLSELINTHAESPTSRHHLTPQVVVMLENIHGDGHLRNPGIDLTFSFAVKESSIRAIVFYNRSLFEEAFIDRAITHYKNIVSGVIRNPHINISNIPMLDEAEKRQLLHDFNNNARSYPLNTTIHDLFEKQVEKTPHSVAAVFKESRLTYRRLNERANQLARLLRCLGIRRGDFAGVLMERSIHFLLSIIAIHKAGGAYVPIDPSYPNDRIKFMLSNSGISFLLTQSSLLNDSSDILSGDSHLKTVVVVDINSGDVSFGQKPDGPQVISLSSYVDLAKTNPEKVNESCDPAYMLYTSGSTGAPKGVVIRHDGTINHICAQLEALQFTPEFSFLQSAPSASDISVWQFLAPILIGGRVVIADNETVSNPKQLFNVIKEERISIIEIVPVVLKAFVEYVSKLPGTMRSLPDLKWMMVTGDVVSVDLVNAWLDIYPLIPVVNCYGPTEASDDIAQFVAEKPISVMGKTVPIGKPLANIRLYILDCDGQLLPVGAPGEICVSGVAVGNGYWNEERMTGESFIPNPFSETPGEYIYKTGDLGRWLPDGNIEFLGRSDHQVKIRGFRIETGEIEATLSQHPGVRDTLIMVRQDESVGKDLVAYWVANAGSRPSVSELRAYMKGRVPEHMIPSVFIELEAMPLMPNGKVDRRALPKADGGLFDGGGCHIAVRTPFEEMLADLWSKLLKSSQVDVNDNFFELGGHSLLATQVISHVRNLFNIELPFRALFENPTLAKLAKYIETSAVTKKDLPAPPLQKVARNGDLPLSFAQQRLWFLDKLQPGSALYNIPAAVRLKGGLNTPALKHGLNEIVRRHEILRTTFPTVDGKARQVISPSLHLPILIVDLQRLSEDEREADVLRLATEEVHKAFSLSCGPLLRVVLLRLDEEDHVLLITMHHIVSDGWSITVFIREILALYQAFAEGRPSPMPDLQIQYADFSAWQREWLSSNLLEEQLAYWKKQFSAPTAMLALPTDRPRPSKQRHHGAIQSSPLPADLLGALQTFNRRVGVTLFMTLLAAFKTLLYRYSRQEDIIVGADIANRNRAEIEGSIGFFVNMLVMRTYFSGNLTVRELLDQIRRVTLDAYANQDVPFEKLVEEVRPARALSHNPLFQVVIVLQNLPTEELHVSGLSITPFDTPIRLAKFDLTLIIEQKEDHLVVFLEYDTDLFESATISRMMAHYRTLLESMISDPDQRLCDLRLLSDKEIGHDVPADFNNIELTQSDIESILMEIGESQK